MSAMSPDIRLGHSFGDDDPPSPSALSRPIDIPSASSYTTRNWESIDFSNPPGLAYTPSYVGSFGSNQDSGWGDREATAVYSAGNADLFDDKYEPESYAGHSPYLMMDDQFSPNKDNLFASSQDNRGGIQVSYNDSEQPQYSPRRDVFNAASPSSSIGIPDTANALGNGNDQGNRSRASSTSSNHGAQSSPYMMSSDYNQPLYDNFSKALSFDPALDSSPAWNNQQGPLSSINRPIGSPRLHSLNFQSMTSPPDMSPTNKPLSPPSLVIPGGQASGGGLMPPTQHMPGRHAASAENGEQQPAINLVPATPVSGGGLGSVNQPFQQMLANLTRQRAQNAPFSRGNTPNAAEALPTMTNFQEPNMGGSGAHSHTQDDAMTWSSIISASGQSQGTAPATLPPSSRVYHHGYNVPVIPDFNSPQQRPQLAMQLNSNNGMPNHTQSDSSVPSMHLPPFSHQSSNPSLDNLASFSESSLLDAPSLGRNRSKSDTSSRPPMWLTNPIDNNNTNMSNDLSSFASSSSFNFNFPMSRPQLPSIFPTSSDQDFMLGMGETSIRRANSDGGRHRRSVKSEDLSSMRAPRLVPTSNSEFIRSVTAADGSLAPVDPRSPPLGGGGGPGPLRRRGSGSGHERNSSLSSVRSTPYQRPSPHTSPGQSPHQSPNHGQSPLPEPYVRVERPLVTTPATKTASANRRRAEASFVCPVPGCGSTFTRHFNLRGHLRSHNEERPFKCKWPGCEKGFARQHDCKRHEALHLNIRPYTCEGCQKTFARMDALNRHLRSEGGVECQRHHQPTDGSPGENGDAPMFPKIEVESSPWAQSGALVM